MYTKEFVDHFRSPRNQGSLADATHTAEAEETGCGDRLALDLRVAAGRIEDARFRVRGCPGAIAVGSVLASLLPGRPARADAVGAEEIERVLVQVPRAKRHALSLARSVLERALASAKP